MTHILSLLTKIITINYIAFLKIQLVLKQTTTVSPSPIPRATERSKNYCVVVTGRILLSQTTKQKPAAARCLWCEGSDRRVGDAVASWPGASLDSCPMPRCGQMIRLGILMLW